LGSTQPLELLVPSWFLSRSFAGPCAGSSAGPLAGLLAGLALCACAPTAGRSPAAPTTAAPTTAAPTTAAPTTPASAAPHAAPAFTAAAWDALGQRLPGKWIATTGATSVPTELRFIARQSALLELWGPPGRETATTYHRDGAQGNQPRLRLSGGDALHPVLTLADSTDHGADEAMLVELSYDLSAAGGLERVEIYRQPDGSLERTVWQLRPAPSAR
jgi:hypothetical protein